MSESGRGSDLFGIQAGLHVPESGREEGTLVVARWDADATDWISRRLGAAGIGQRGFRQPNWPDFHRYGVKPYQVTEDTSNVLVSGGWDRVLTRATGGTAAGWASATCRIGVGTATAATATGQADLSAATAAGSNRYWMMVTGDGTVGTGTATRRVSYVATFGTGVANFAWQEAAIDQGTAAADNGAAITMLNRIVSNQGTKASGQTWTATFLLDFS